MSRLARAGVAIIAMGVVAMGVAVAGQAPLRSIPAADAPPAAVVDAGAAARHLFDAARDSQWEEAASQLGALQRALANLPNDAGSGALRRTLRTRAHDLTQTVAHKRRLATMEAANDVTRFAADLANTYHTNVPAQLRLLDYYGRQLQIGIVAHRPALIKRATADLRQAWNDIRPQLEQRGRFDDVRRLTDIVATLGITKRPADVERLAEAELSAVDRLQAEMK